MSAIIIRPLEIKASGQLPLGGLAGTVPYHNHRALILHQWRGGLERSAGDLTMFLLNTAPNVIIWQITGSRAAVLILTFAIGCVTGWLVGIQQKKSGGKIIAESASSN